MRTTLTLEPDVEKLLHDEQYRTKKTFKEVLNSAVRTALRPAPRKRPKLLPPRAMGLRTGVDPRDLAGLADDLEAESYLRTSAKRRR
ncbi:MAG: antitoxin [Chthoniobacterales bacterium]|nr:antitoxin [Chthoniobacterales bacterium]